MINVGSLEAKAFNVLCGNPCVVIANGDTMVAQGVLLLEEGEQQVYAQRESEMASGRLGKKDVIQVVVITTFASDKVPGTFCPF